MLINDRLRWQVYQYLTGYNYKNSIANGCFFNIAARLARYTQNETYAQYAEKIWNWQIGTGFIDATYNVYDGAHLETNCTDINKVLFSYNAGVFMLGAAYMYNYVRSSSSNISFSANPSQTNSSAEWKTRLDGIIQQTMTTFFVDDVAYEVACEPKLTCTTDMFSFKAYLMRWMAGTTKLAPYTAIQMMPKIQKSAEAAAAQCVGGSTGRQCGLSWSSGKYDGTYGVGQQMAAMSAIFSNLVPSVGAPYTNSSGGSSKGNNNAGGKEEDPNAIKPATSADKAGAGILTTLVLVGITGMLGWMSL